MKQTIIELTEKYVYNQLKSDASGHDWFHIDRVRKLALHIAREERKGNEFIIELAALLHDIPDDKLNQDAMQGLKKLDEWFERLNWILIALMLLSRLSTQFPIVLDTYSFLLSRRKLFRMRTVWMQLVP